MIKLPQVTLIALTGLGYKTDEHVYAIKKSCEGIEFGAVVLVQLAQIKDIESWNRAVIHDLYKYVPTSHALFIHHDGYVINPGMWRNEWLELDYIGAPFPPPQDDFSYRDEEGEIQRVGNSVSLRSKNLMHKASTFEWKPYHGFYNEDGFIAVNNRKKLEKAGYKFGTLEQAVEFSKEHEIPENVGISSFAFHSL